MFDREIRNLASILIGYSLEVQPGQNVLLTGPTDAEPLILECYERCLQLGAYPWIRLTPTMMEAIFYRVANEQQIDFLSPIDKDVLDQANCMLFIRTETNSDLLKNTKTFKMLRRRKAVGSSFKYLKNKRWCSSFFPSVSLAKRAGLSLIDFSRIFYKSVNRPWAELAQKDLLLAERLNKAVKIQMRGKNTDLSFSVAGRKALVGAGKYNMPDGEVFTAPIEDSVEGYISFDIPVYFEGNVIIDARINFRDGEALDADAKVGESLLLDLLAVDDGSRRVGEFAIGTNNGLKRPLGHIAFDEKLCNSFHLAIGFSPEGTKGENQSAIHFDLLGKLNNVNINIDGKLFSQNDN